MAINLSQLEMNVNLHSLHPGFLNRELHYIIATDENNFRFAELEDAPRSNEKKFFCFLTDKEMVIPAGNITLHKSYTVVENPVYDILTEPSDFFPFVDCIDEQCAAKAIRNFPARAIPSVFEALKQKYVHAEQHQVKSPEFQHILIILPHVEISISATMVYFRQRLPDTIRHYENLKEEQTPV